MSKLKVVAVSGNLTSPSRTLVLAQEILAAIASQHAIDSEVIQLADLGPLIGTVGSRNALNDKAAQAIDAIESADLLIAVSPVYRGAYTGLFKHVFDLVDQNALLDVPVLIGATGGSERHTLVIEHVLRPLFSFFGAQTVPFGVYGTEQDFKDYAITSDVLRKRIEVAAHQALALALLRIDNQQLRAIA